jgi:exodeoxyribonuclease-3
VRLRILSYNIRVGGRGRAEGIAEVIRAQRPDLVVLQEAVDPSVVTILSKSTSLPFHGSAWRRSVAFLSRVPVERFSWQRPRWSQHAFLEIQPADAALRIVGVHLSAVHAAWTERRRVYEVRSLLAAVERTAPRVPTLLIGDFNTLAPGERLDISRLPRRLRALVWVSGGTIRYETIHTMVEAGYVDGFRHLHPTDVGHTFPTWDPQVRLDYAFLPAVDASRMGACHVVTAPAAVRTASDHFPLLVEVDASAPPG